MGCITVIDREFTKDATGHYTESSRTEYKAKIINNNLVINDKYLPILHDYGWSIRTLKTRIYTHYTPTEFFNEFFDNDIFLSTRINLCKHITKYGRPAADIERR